MRNPVILSFLYLIAANNYDEVNNATLDLHLYQLGYLQPEIVTNRSIDKPWATKSALKEFQSSMQLNQSGKLDDDTWNKMEDIKRATALKTFHNATNQTLENQFDEYGLMQTVRCGRPEPVNFNSYKKGPRKWKKTNLTYSIDKYWKNTLQLMRQNAIKELIREAFSIYSEATHLRFTEVTSRGDIKIRFESKVHEDSQIFDGRGGILAHAFLPGDGRIHFDDDEYWENMRGKNEKTLFRIMFNHTDLLTVAMHEIGHALGLEHAENRPFSIMAPMIFNPIFKNERTKKYEYVTPTLDDAVIDELKALYPEPTTEETTMETHHNRNCMGHVFGVLSLPGHRIAFFSQNGSLWMMFNSESFQMIQNVTVSELFKPGPNLVSAAYYNESNKRIVLFYKDRVWAYDFDSRLSEVAIANNYPQSLSMYWRTSRAFMLSQHVMLVSNNVIVSSYNEDGNSMEFIGFLDNVFPNMPQEVIGFAEYENGTLFGFTETEVFKYRTEHNITVKIGRITDIFHCIS